MKTVLIPVDFSTVGRHAAEFGMALAQHLDADVHLIHVYTLAIAPYNEGMVTDMTPWNNALYYQAQDSLKAFRHNLLKRTGSESRADRVATRVVPGNPAGTILAVADELKPSYIVMGTVGASGAWDKLIGSTAAEVARRAKCSVWVIPRQVKLEDIHTISYFTDLSGDEIKGVHQVTRLADLLHARASVVHMQSEEEDERMAAKALIERLEEAFAGHESLRFWNLSVTESLEESVDYFLKQYKPDAVILARHHRGFLDNLFHRSLIRHLSLTAKTPLLVIPQ